VVLRVPEKVVVWPAVGEDGLRVRESWVSWRVVEAATDAPAGVGAWTFMLAAPTTFTLGVLEPTAQSDASRMAAIMILVRLRLCVCFIIQPVLLAGHIVQDDLQRPCVRLRFSKLTLCPFTLKFVKRACYRL